MSTAKLFLCLDQGGHASRAIVFDSHGNVIARAYREIATHRQDERVEHDPDELVQSLREAAEDVAGQLGSSAGNLVAAGLATQRSSIVCWQRASGSPLSPVISWQDTRAQEWLDQFLPQAGRVHKITGLVLSPHYGVSKLRWCLDNLPDVRAAADRGELLFGPLASYLANRLLAESPVFADPANASRTLLWDRASRDWSDELLNLFGIERQYLPATAPSRHAWGSLALAGMKLPLQVVTGDQSAALFAFGLPKPSVVYANMGTGAFLQRSLQQHGTDPGQLLASVVYQDGVKAYEVIEATVNGAGSAIAALAHELQLEEDYLRQNSAGWLEAMSGDLVFLNAVSGLGSPWWRADLESRFAGNDVSCASAADKIAAVMESIVFLVAVNLAAMQDLLGKPQRLLLTGGLGSVDTLAQKLANVSGLTVERAHSVEATARGLAYLLAGMPADWPAARVERRFAPHVDRAMQARFDYWLSLMPEYETAAD